MNSQQLYAIVLAAGKSVRFGSLKQLTLFDNKPLVSHAVATAEKTCQSNSILVTGKNWRKVYNACGPIKGFHIHNSEYENGIASSIACGIKAVESIADAVLLLFCDQPLISPNYLKKMIKTWDGSKKNIIASSYEKIACPPIIFPRLYFRELLKLEGDKGGNSLLKKHTEFIIKLPCKEAMLDIDTPRDMNAINK